MDRENIPNRVDLRLRYFLPGMAPTQEYVLGVLIFLTTPREAVEKMIENFKENKDVDVYLLIFEEGCESEKIEKCVESFKEAFPDLEIRVQRDYPKETMDYMYASMEVSRERRIARLN